MGRNCIRIQEWHGLTKSERSEKTINVDEVKHDIAEPEGICEEMTEEVRRVVYWCPLCSYVTARLGDFNTHVRKFHTTSDLNGKLYPIHLTDVVTKKKLVYENGMEMTKYHCQLCSRVFTSSIAMAFHLRVLQDGGLSCLSLCPQGAVLKMSIKIAKSLFNQPKATHICNQCGKSYSNSSYLAYHLDTVHSSMDRKYTCEFCSATFLHKKNLQKHRKIHERGDKKYMCETCGKPYISLSGLTRHVTVEHQKHIMYPCPVCSKLFFPKGNLNKHVQNVHDALPIFSCSQCGQKFSSPYNLKVHERIHTGFKPYKCTVCVAAFAQKNSLNVHMRKHGLEIQTPRRPAGLEDDSV